MRLSSNNTTRKVCRLQKKNVGSSILVINVHFNFNFYLWLKLIQARHFLCFVVCIAIAVITWRLVAMAVYVCAGQHKGSRRPSYFIWRLVSGDSHSYFKLLLLYDIYLYMYWFCMFWLRFCEIHAYNMNSPVNLKW